LGGAASAEHTVLLPRGHPELSKESSHHFLGYTVEGILTKSTVPSIKSYLTEYSVGAKSQITSASKKPTNEFD
jgi:hypothetical protein